MMKFTVQRFTFDSCCTQMNSYPCANRKSLTPKEPFPGVHGVYYLDEFLIFQADLNTFFMRIICLISGSGYVDKSFLSKKGLI